MIFICPDKFKGTLTARQAAEAIEAGLRDAGVTAPARLCPMADGGDGTAEVLAPLLPDGECVAESRLHVGPECFRSIGPMLRSSHAFGTALRRALESHSHVYAAIGGTACCDGGAGMLQALGMRAFAADGSEITQPLSPALLPLVARIDCAGLPPGARITVLSDVRASLVPDGSQPLSALDFAAQKGFTDADMPRLEAALRLWRSVASPLRSEADGAAGGIGYALASVMGCGHRSGAAFAADSYGLQFAPADLVISGEGRIDAQTGAGKVVGEMHARARAAGCGFLAIGGSVCGRHPFATLSVSRPGDSVPSTPAEAARRLRAAVRYFFSCTISKKTLTL